VNGPAPIGLSSKACWPLASAAGEAIQFIELFTIAWAKFGAGAAIATPSVRASTTVVAAIEVASVRYGERVAGSFIRSQLNFTAAASSGVPSENTSPSRRVRVNVAPASVVSNDSAIRGTMSAPSLIISSP
jgi:hypothetical protein